MKKRTSNKCHHCRARVVEYSGARNLCAKHHRFGQMRRRARYRNIYAPSNEELELALSDIRNMRCPVCGQKMNWFAKDGRNSVTTLQHYRDDTFGLCCFVCNIRHGQMPGDTFNNLLDGMKWCFACKETKLVSEFYVDKKRNAYWSPCKECQRAKVRRWQAANRQWHIERCRRWRAAQS